MDATPGLARMTVVRIGVGVYRVETDGRAEVVYVAGQPGSRWAFWNGRVFRQSIEPSESEHAQTRRDTHQQLSAPMPATVLKVLVAAGTQVKKGDTLVILEAMKMELPLRATADATVAAVRCRQGELVQPDAVLVELS